MEYIGSAFWILIVIVVFATMISNARKAAAQRDRTGGQPVQSLPQRVSHLREVQSRAVRTMADVSARPAAPPPSSPAVSVPPPVSAAAIPRPVVVPVATPAPVPPVLPPLPPLPVNASFQLETPRQLVASPPTGQIRLQFQERGTWVRALIAAEVLGPPVSLREQSHWSKPLSAP